MYMAEEAIIEKEEPFDAAQGKQTTENKEQLSLEEMTAAGLQFGHKTSKTHPKMKPYVASVRNTIHLINLEKTREKLQEALAAISGLVANGKVVLLVGTKVQAKGAVRELAEATGLPYVTERWIGGLLTNFETVSKRISHLKDLEVKKQSEEFQKYTKWEQLQMEEEIQRLNKKFGGVKTLGRLPDVMFIFDLDKNELARKEAKLKGLKIFALCDTDCDPSLVDYAIPANDDAVSSIKYIARKLQETLLRVKTQ